MSSPGRPKSESRSAQHEGTPVSTSVPTPPRELVLITGISGSGKSVALHALEDAGFFCVDNLPPELLQAYMHLEHPRYVERVAIAVDVRAARSLPALVPLIDELRGDGVKVRPLFL
ncbi:MAG: hypothetical protein HY021_04885, partial [Burkholderiales bacterium]|nr:hypothetical protein [Burkholderiales bacterium]